MIRNLEAFLESKMDLALLIDSSSEPSLTALKSCQLSFAIFLKLYPALRIKEPKLEIVTSWSHTIMIMLVARDYLVGLLCLTTAVLGDYQDYSNYLYPETYSYPDNTSLASYYPRYHNQPTQASKRLFDQGFSYWYGSATFDVAIPIPDLGTTLYCTMPFRVQLPSTARDATGRSLDGSGGSQGMRSSLYRGVEKYLGHVTGADGQSCLLRAMCEASSIPLHDEGLIGDVITFLLTTNYATEEEDDKFKKYFAAQAKGQVS